MTAYYQQTVRRNLTSTTTSLDSSEFAMEFDLRGLPAGDVVNAKLIWTETQDVLLPFNEHPLFGQTGDGLMTAADFTGGTKLYSVTSNGSNSGTIPGLNVTSFIDARYASGDDFVSFRVDNDGFNVRTTITQVGQTPGSVTTSKVEILGVRSRLATDPALRPRLEITVVPEVPAASLGFLSLVALLALRSCFVRRHFA